MRSLPILGLRDVDVKNTRFYEHTAHKPLTPTQTSEQSAYNLDESAWSSHQILICDLGLAAHWIWCILCAATVDVGICAEALIGCNIRVRSDVNNPIKGFRSPSCDYNLFITCSVLVRYALFFLLIAYKNKSRGHSWINHDVEIISLVCAFCRKVISCNERPGKYELLSFGWWIAFIRECFNMFQLCFGPDGWTIDQGTLS